MPPPPPPLRPLLLDGPAVAAAIDACTRTAALVGGLVEARAAAATVARGDWQGATRDRFDVEVARLDHDAAGLIAELLRLAAALGAAAGDVAAENRRRAESAQAWARAQAAVVGVA